MKKLILSAFLATAMIAGGTAYAQSKGDGKTGATVQKENVNKGGKTGDKGGMKKAPRTQFNPFDGVQLTPDQQQRLQVLRQGLGPVELTPEQQDKIPENPNLTPEQKKQLKEERKQLKQQRKAQKLENKKKYLSGVKEILTPDQYVVFLENCYIYSPQNQGKSTIKKHDKKHKKENRGEKGKKSAKTNQK